MTSFRKTIDYNSTAVVFADPNSISLSLIQTLLKNNLKVKIISRSLKKWKNNDLLGEFKENVEILSFTDKNLLQCAYVVLVIGFSLPYQKKTYAREKKRYKKIFVEDASLGMKLAEKSDAKLMVIAPFVQNEIFYESKITDFIKDNAQKKNIDLRLCYVGQIIAPKGSWEQDDLVSSMIKDAATGKKVKLIKGGIKLYPVDIENLLSFFERILFSFSVGFSEVVIVSQPFSPQDFFEEIRKIIPRAKSETLDFFYNTRNPETKKVIIEVNINRALRLALESYSKSKVKEVKETRIKFKKGRVERDKIVSNKSVAIFTIGLFMIVFFIPFYSLFVSASSLILATKNLKKGNLGGANQLFVFTQRSASFAEKGMIRYSETPLVGDFFAPGAYISDLLEKSSLIGERSVLIAKTSSKLFEKILGNDPYVVDVVTNDISVELDSLYKDLGFLQSEIESSFGLSKKVLGYFAANEGVLNIRQKVLLGKELVDELPKILGQEGRKTYLILFQNNMELRPTGGFIGSFALTSFENGRLIDVSIQDVYSADGQLKGHIDPPEPIKNYLGEANWYLRDSNWDPDFPTSAERAEWFLDKELDVVVDGVVGIDLELVKEILKQTGPILIADFNQLVDHNNLYEKTQYEVEKDFFPGSRKKANFLTALARELLLKFSDLTNLDYLNIAISFFNSLNQRHVQIFLHDQPQARIISDFGWDGAVKIPTCQGNCFADWFGVVEANLGVNKANYFIKRTSNMIISFDNNKVERFLSVSYVNSASSLLGQTGSYKAYVRILIPQESELLQIELVKGNEKDLLEPEITFTQGRKEVGILINIDSGKTRTLNVSWAGPSNLDFSLPGIYTLNWRKQPGTKEDPAVVRFFFPKNLKIYAKPSFSLTGTTSKGYNFFLSEDLNSRVSW